MQRIGLGERDTESFRHLTWFLRLPRHRRRGICESASPAVASYTIREWQWHLYSARTTALRGQGF